MGRATLFALQAMSAAGDVELVAHSAGAQSTAVQRQQHQLTSRHGSQRTTSTAQEWESSMRPAATLVERHADLRRQSTDVQQDGEARFGPAAAAGGAYMTRLLQTGKCRAASDDVPGSGNLSACWKLGIESESAPGLGNGALDASMWLVLRCYGPLASETGTCGGGGCSCRTAALKPGSGEQSAISNQPVKTQAMQKAGRESADIVTQQH